MIWIVHVCVRKGYLTDDLMALCVYVSCRLPEGFTQLQNLTHLYLNDTFLDYLPGSFGRWVFQHSQARITSHTPSFLPSFSVPPTLSPFPQTKPALCYHCQFIFTRIVCTHRKRLKWLALYLFSVSLSFPSLSLSLCLSLSLSLSLPLSHTRCLSLTHCY